MFKRVLILAMGLLFVLPVFAQNDPNSPRAAVDAALTAVEEQVGTRATNFTFQFFGETTDSSLNCPLVTGEELPFSTEVVIVTVIYPDGQQYIVHTSISGQIAILCSDNFDADLLASQTSDENRCTVTPIQALPAYTAPNITLDGVFTAGVEAYDVYGKSSDGGWYQIASDLGLGWVEATSVTIAGDCNTIPTTSVTNPVADGVCFVEPQGGFTNVRSIPSVDGNLVGRIYENEVHQASARSTDATWFYIQPAGWVSNTVTFQLGDCTNITVNDNAVGVGFATEEGDADTDAAVILERFACPPDFAGYLVPRISVGEATAQIEAGTVPNTLRGFPSVDDAEAPRLGVIQPSRVIDRVIAGPACNQGFVWWLVEIDEAVGWTAESNQSSNDYFIEPTGDAPTSDVPASELQPIEVSTNPIQEVVYSATGNRIFAQTIEQGFGDGTLGVVLVYDAVNGASLARVEEPSGIVDIDVASELNLLLVGAGNGIVTLYNMATLEQVAQVTDAYEVAEGAHIETSFDGRTLLIASCIDDTCSASQVIVLNASDGEILASAPISERVLALELSADSNTVAVMTPSGISFHAVPELTLISQWENMDEFSLNSIILNDVGSSALFAGCNNIDCTEGRIGLINVNDGSLLGIVPSHNAAATNITYNPEQTRFVTLADASGDLIERNAITGDEIQRFNFTEADLTDIAYAPTGNVIAVGTVDGRVVFLTPAQ